MYHDCPIPLIHLSESKREVSGFGTLGGVMYFMKGGPSGGLAIGSLNPLELSLNSLEFEEDSNVVLGMAQ